MSTHSFDNTDYASIICTKTPPQTVQILCKCKRSNQSKDVDSVIKIRCSEKNCINRMESNGNGVVDEFEFETKDTRYTHARIVCNLHSRNRSEAKESGEYRKQNKAQKKLLRNSR